MRTALSITESVDILDHIYTLPAPDQETAFQKIRAIESSAMATQAPQPGLLPLMTYLEVRVLLHYSYSPSFIRNHFGEWICVLERGERNKT
jgi:hypothetical protein